MIQGIGQEITEIPAFGHDITEVRAMGQLAWQKQTSIPDYLCFTALEAGQFTLTIPAAVTASYLSYVEWSKDGRTWNHRDNTSGEVVTIQVDVASGGKVYWRGKAQRYATSTTNYCCFSSDCRFTAKGVLKSLLFAEDFVTHVDGTWTSVYNYALSQLFRGCTTLIDASELILPSGHLAVAQLLGLFRDCTNLVRGADLPATGVNGSSYYWLYYNCTSLERLPNIAATTITDISGGNGNYAFYCAFYDCTSMTGSVTLNLTQVKGKQLFDTCFRGCKISSVDITMQSYDLQGAVFRNCFYLCTNLNHVRCTIDPSLATSDDFQNWLYGVSSTGIFIQAEGVEWPRGASGIPTGWVDVEKRTMPSGYKQVEYLQAVKPYPSNYNAAIVGTGIVLDPSQDTIEFAVWPRLDEDGYLINGSDTIYGEMPFANNSSPTGNNVKVGTFYVLYRVNSSANMLQCSYTTENGDSDVRAVAKNVTSNVRVTDNPQTIRIEFSATSAVMLLNGTQVSSASGYTVDTSDMTTLQAFVLAYNNKIYNWEHPFYYLKWWRGANLIADYVPCVRESDDEVGFYDFVSQTFKTRLYTNSEPFTAGEEI